MDELVPFMKIKGIQTFGAATWTDFLPQKNIFFVEEVSLLSKKLLKHPEHDLQVQ